MRIVCQKCSAAYAIDDKFVTDKGVRAQCPRCRHLQLVKRDDPLGPEAPTLPARPSAPGFELAMGGPGPAAPPPPAPSSSAGFNFEFGSPPSSAGASGGGFDFGSLPPQPAASRPPSQSFGAPRPSAPQAGSGCKSCGKLMTDPFDLALGICDDCRNKAQQPTGAPPPDSGAGRVELVDSSGIHQRLSAAQIEKAQAELQAAQAPVQDPVMPEPNFEIPLPTTVEVGAVRTALRARAGVGAGRLIALAVGVLLVLGLGLVIVIKRPWVRKPPPLVVKRPEAKPVEGIVQQWRLSYPELEGESSKSAKAFVDSGEALLANDTTSAYQGAEEAFQKALVLDSGDERAVAGWVLALAFGHAGQVDAQTAKSAESMLLAAEQRTASHRVFVAHAHFLIARGGNPNDVRVLAERGQSSLDAADKALAALALGQTYLTKNPQLAETSFKDALSLDPKQKRSYFFLAQLAVSQGRYKDAIGHLERRLALDKDQWEAAEELARLFVDVGELSKAKRVLEAAKAAAPRAGRPRLGLAMLAYQHQDDLAGAQAQLQALVDGRDTPRAEKADALTHLATVSRLQGNTARAAELSSRALELNPESVPARLQRFLVMLDKGAASEARTAFDALKGRLADKYLEATLEGRLMATENRLEDAVRVLSGVQEADARRADALLLAAAAAAKGRKEGKAWELCLKRGLKLDPGVMPVASLTHLYVHPADILAPAGGAFLALAPNAAEDPNPHLCEGLVAWFSGNPVTAEKHFARVTAIDTGNANAYAYRALFALRKLDLSGATRLASRGVDAGKTNALGHYASAQVLLQSRKADQAKQSAASALKFNPALLGAKVVVADVEARNGDGAEARRLLTTVLLNDPHYRDAKRVLYKHAL